MLAATKEGLAIVMVAGLFCVRKASAAHAVMSFVGTGDMFSQYAVGQASYVANTAW